MARIEPEERPVQIVLSDIGTWGSITIHGKEVSVRSIKIAVESYGETLVSLRIPSQYCNIRFDYESSAAFWGHLAEEGQANDGEAE